MMMSQTWAPRHTVLWAVNCKIVTEVVSGALGLLVEDFWDKDNNNASNENTDLLKEVILLGC